METLNSCPSCGNTSVDLFLESEDYFLTKEKFSVFLCHNCGLKYTNPRPAKEELPDYYESEEYFSHDTGNTSVFASAYKIARRIALRRKTSLVKNHTAGNKILDIGCGTGEFLKVCKKEGFDVTGIEPNEKAATFAKEVNQIPVFSEEHLEKLPANSFDVITLWHVLEHVPDLNERMRTVKRLLKEMGTIIIAVPNASSPDALHYGKFWAAYDLPRHLYHFNPESFDHLARRHEFRISQILPMKMDAFYISLLSEKYLKGKSDIFSAFISGLRSNAIASKNISYSSIIFVLKNDFAQN